TAILEALVEGNNPDWNQGQPVKLSLTIEENIHALVKSLRTAQVLTRNIEQSIERSMENQ
ncbi:MAG: YdbH domain-containing protein, partial [Pseudomonadota bacterium]|nr:YdbH domain-containing protein [Pseudomonadota bacterium]